MIAEQSRQNSEGGEPIVRAENYSSELPEQDSQVPNQE